MPHYMIVETFRPGCKEAVYERLQRNGRMLPDGLTFIDSWVEKDGDRCFQLMETHDRSLLTEWMGHWSDLVEFEVVEIANRGTSE